MRKTIAGLLMVFSASAHALLAGDIAFTSFNADEDGWSIVALSELAPGSSVYFTENAFNTSTGGFEGSEGFYTWDIGAGGVLAGTVVRFSTIQNTGRAASTGSLSARGGTALSQTGETLFAYLGTSDAAPTLFLAALTTESATASLLAGTGLAFGLDAIALAVGADYGDYRGARGGEADFGAYRRLVNAPANWQAELTGTWDAASPDLTAFTVATPAQLAAPLPEPASALLLVGALAGLLAQRCRGARPSRRSGPVGQDRFVVV